MLFEPMSLEALVDNITHTEWTVNRPAPVAHALLRAPTAMDVVDIVRALEAPSCCSCTHVVVLHAADHLSLEFPGWLVLEAKSP